MEARFLQVYHGCAETTVAGLKAAWPKTIMPFSGDLSFYGEQVHGREVDPPSTPVDEFLLPKLVDTINFMLDPKVKEHGVELARAKEMRMG